MIKRPRTHSKKVHMFRPHALDENGNLLIRRADKKRINKMVSIAENKNEMRYSLPGSDGRTLADVPANLVHTTPVAVYVPENVTAHGALTFTLAVRDMFQASTAMTCAMYKTAICTLAPGLKEDFNSAFKQMGYSDEEILIPKDALDNGVRVTVPKVLNQDEQAVTWALCILILFKNVTSENYEQFMENRKTALCSIVGIKKDQVKNPVELNRAEEIRLYFGSKNSLKRRVVSWIVANSDGSHSINQACDYVLGILAWYEMDNFTMMHEALCLTHSPVLIDPRVRKEVIALERALRLINACPHPPLYWFFAEPKEKHLLDRIQFPTLIAVAIAIKKESTPSMKNCAVPKTVSPDVLKSLIAVHNYQRSNPVEVPFSAAMR